MAGITSQLSSYKQERAEIETTLPFESVKAAVSLFGERVGAKSCKLPEKHGAKEVEMHQLQEELANMRLQLTDAERSKAKVSAELRDAKKLLEEMMKNSGQSYLLKQSGNLNVSTRSNADEIKQNTSHAEEKHVVGEVQLKVAQEQHMTAVAELEVAKKELERLQQELQASRNEKDCAIKQAEEALSAAETNAKRVEELSTEISGTNESLVLVKLACIEASKEREALLASKRAEGRGGADSQASDQDFAAVQELELKLAAATKELNMLREELQAAKEAQEKVVREAAEAFANLARAKSDLERIQIPATSAITSWSDHSTELRETKLDLEKALSDESSLRASMGVLQNELNMTKKGEADLREREANANAAIVSLTNELHKTKSELAEAVAAEARANEAISGLSQTLQQITAEVEEAKETAEAMKEEACKAKADAEQAKAAMKTAEIELEAALKEAEAAKAAETIALNRFRDLFEKTDAARASEVEAGAGITISQEEYDSLRKKMHEAEELADMRVAAAAAQVEAVKASELEIQQRLETLNDDIDAMKNMTRQAVNRAEIAEAAKSAVESEMSRWREKELQLREREIMATAEKNNMKTVSHSQPLPFTRPPPHAASLAQVLNIKLPNLEKESGSTDQALVTKKKKPLLPSFGSLVGKKKNHTTNRPPSSNLLKI